MDRQSATVLSCCDPFHLESGYIPLKYAYVQVFEEGFKFIGAATWLYFSWRSASFYTLHVTEINSERK